MTSLAEQTLVDTFEVMRVLGKGSFGKVFLVRDTVNNQEYAMKKYSKYHLSTNAKEKSLKRSIRILHTLDHVNIIKFLKYTVTTEDSIFLIFEGCKKGSLQEIKGSILKSKDEDIVNYVLYQLVQGLLYLKSMSVAHRDLKPANIAFNSQGELKIIDFDEAVCFKDIVKDKQLNFNFSDTENSFKMISRRSFANSYVGTDSYMSPQMKLKTQSDERGDTWALGCIIFELTVNETLHLMFQHEDQLSEGIHKKMDYLKGQKQINKHCIDLIEKILITDPDSRINIQEIHKHPYFDQARENASYRQHCKMRFRKLLRGNYFYDALQIDLIGMKEGLSRQRIRLLETVVFVKRDFAYDLYFLYGGPRYFKLANVDNQSDKIYLWYDSICKLCIKGDHLIVGVRAEPWSRENNTFQLSIKHLYPDMLGRLIDLMNYILVD